MKKIIKNFKKALLLTLAITFLFSFSYAISVASIKLPDFNFDKDKNFASVNFTIVNIDKQNLKDYVAELRFLKMPQNEEIGRIRLNLDNLSWNLANSSADFSDGLNIKLPKGVYQPVLVLLKDKLGVVSVSKLPLIEIKKSNISEKRLSLDCKKVGDVAEKNIKLTCSTNSKDDNLSVKYGVYTVGALREITSNIVTVQNTGGQFSLSIPIDFNYSGLADVKLVILDDNSLPVSKEVYLRYTIPGDFVEILSLSKSQKDSKIEVLLSGTLNSLGRKMLVGLLDGGKLCFQKEIDLTTVAPLRKSFSFAGSKCTVNAKPVVIIFKGGKDNVKLITYAGVGSKSYALSILDEYLNAKYSKKGTFNDVLSYKYMLYAILGIVVLILLFAVLSLSKRKFLSVLALFVFISVSVAAAATLTQNIGVANPITFSEDAPKIKFLVNFLNVNNEVGQNDNIVFDLSALDNFSATLQKYPGTEIYASLDGGNTEALVMQATDPDPTVTVSLPHSLSLGDHEITFRVPDMCGSAYDYSSFNNAEFGTKDCIFTTPFTVVQSATFVNLTANPLAVPQGGTTNLTWYLSSDIVSCTASGAWSGAKSTNPVNTEVSQNLNLAPHSYDFRLSCTNDKGESYTDNVVVVTYNCGDGVCTFGETCNNCATDCGACATDKFLEIYANPRIVKTGNSTEIIWKSLGYKSCEVTEDNDSINDYWTGLAKQVTSSPLISDTTYTLTCTDGSQTDSKSVKVRVAPSWIEY